MTNDISVAIKTADHAGSVSQPSYVTVSCSAACLYT